MQLKTLTMPLIPVRGIVIFPYMVLHFDVAREKSIRALEAAMQNGQTAFLTTQIDAAENEPGADGVYRIGTVAKIRQLLRLPQNYVRVLVEGISRAELMDISTEGDFYTCEVKQIRSLRRGFDETEMEAAKRVIDRLFEEYLSLNKRANGDLYRTVSGEKDFGKYLDFLASNFFLRPADKQAILEEKNIAARAEKFIVILEGEVEVLRTENEIQGKVQENLAQHRKEAYLREQLQVISRELGDDFDEDITNFENKIYSKALPDEVREKAEKELGKLRRQNPSSPEAAVTYTYLETLLDMPYGIRSMENENLRKAERILERDHFGLEKVKERLLEYLAVRKLAGDLRGQILCLVGPPGVGKTSIVKSVAEALGREYVRISLGGVHDEAEIRGHRKTYIGSMPGRIMDAVRRGGTENPLILLDEIDKLGQDYKGDPASALLEVLDPAQNHSFRDHYLDVPFSLENVMFITTANDRDRIPRPLYDRMEVIEISGYTEEEKLEIAMRHLLPKTLRSHGLWDKNVTVRRDAMRTIIEHYTREAGVRQLEREIAHLCRRIAGKVTKGEEKITVTAKNTEDYLGKYKFIRDTETGKNEIGTASGLAWTAVGGETLRIEVATMPGTGKVQLTGSLGDVMKESASAAVSFIRTRAEMLGIDPDFYKNRDLHIHVPEGAVPKDGPSAGITLATAVASALSLRPVLGDIAMTGEITLRGKVLPVGGIKEKLLAAHRLGKKTVLIPKENLRDTDELPASVKKALSIIPVSDMDEVFSLALLPGDKKQAGEPDYLPNAQTFTQVQA